MWAICFQVVTAMGRTDIQLEMHAPISLEQLIYPAFHEHIENAVNILMQLRDSLFGQCGVN